MLKKELDSWKPRSFQAEGVKLCISQACAGLLFFPGGGKTSTMYAVINILQTKKYINKVLVICPLRPAYNVWPEQLKRYKEFAHLRVAVLHGKDKEAALHSDADIYVINPEGLEWLFGATLVKNKVTFDAARQKLIKEKFQMLVVDESTKFKNPQSQRFKMLRAFVPFFKRRYILTGTPTPKGLMDLFGQIYILDEGQSLGRYITHYRNEYFYPSGFGGYEWSPQVGAADRIGNRISQLVLRVSASGNIDLPDIVFDDIWVDLPPSVVKLYARMEADLVALLETGTIVAANAAVASSKCRQMANGSVFDSEEKGLWHEVHDVKLKALEDLIEQLQGEPLLVTYEFVPDRERIAEKLKIPCISTGNAKRDSDNITRFARGELPAVMGQPQSISLGIDGLQDSCHHIAMVGCPWNLQDYEQTIDRVHRQGSKSSKVIVHRILARNTVDERVLAVLDARDKDQQSFMKLLEDLRAER